MNIDKETQPDVFYESCEKVLAYANQEDYAGYGKHDALNSPLIKSLTFNQKWLRLVAIQSIMRSPVNLRPFFGVKKYRNPKGIGLFVRSYINLAKLGGERADQYASQACVLADWLLSNAAQGHSGACWGYNWDWQDAGFFAPFASPNCVVTTFVGQALLDTYELTGDEKYLQIVESSTDFILNDLKILFEDASMKCISYVPEKSIRMRIMDVSALAGALLARVSRWNKDSRLTREAKKLINFVVDKQTPAGGWYYTDPPGDSPVKIDNYHTGFILDTLLDYELSTGDTSFRAAYRLGLDFYLEHLFLENGAPKWRSDGVYPMDIHGAATGAATFSRAALHENAKFMDVSEKIAAWAIQEMQTPAGYFYFQKQKYYTKKFTLMRWCDAWMAYGLSSLLLAQHQLGKA